MVEWLQAFVFTEIIETPIYYAALHGRQIPVRLLGAFGASVITHPIVWWLVSATDGDGYWTMVAGAEAFAVLAEARYLSLLAVSAALPWSLVANASSLGIGFAFHFLWNFP